MFKSNLFNPQSEQDFLKYSQSGDILGFVTTNETPDFLRSTNDYPFDFVGIVIKNANPTDTDTVVNIFWPQEIDLINLYYGGEQITNYDDIKKNVGATKPIKWIVHKKKIQD